MQTGVALDMESDPSGTQGATTPKHLRVGVNSAMAEHGGLADLLIEKGIITEAEYREAVAAAMEREKERYEDILSERYGRKITLA